MLASLLNSHPEVYVSLEAEYLLSAMQFRQDQGRFPENEELKQMLKEDKRLAEWNFEWPELFERLSVEKDGVSLKLFTEALLKETAESESPKSKIVLLKQGLLSGYLYELREIWPAAFLIHIYRDGRAVFASKKRAVNIDSLKPMAVDPVQSAHRWMRVQKNVEAIGDSGQLIEVRYEELVQSEAPVLQSIWHFLNVAPLERNELSGTDYAGRIPVSQKGIHQLVGKKPDPSRMEAWKINLTLREIHQYEKTAREWLVKRNYRPVTGNISGIASLFLTKFKSRSSGTS